MSFTAKLPSRTNYVDEVYKVLLDAISDGSLAPGTRITQEEVAEQLDVSRSPVIQALRQLKTDGLVQDAPGRGVLIAPLDPQTIGHVYKIRGVLDEYDAIFTVAEVGGQDALREMQLYTHGHKRLNSAYGFDFLYAPALTPELVAARGVEACAALSLRGGPHPGAGAWGPFCGWMGLRRRRPGSCRSSPATPSGRCCARWCRWRRPRPSPACPAR